MTQEYQRPRTIVRYTFWTRFNHWLNAAAFILAALSGLALYHPATNWLTGLFGGGVWTRVLHPFIGVFMFVMFILLALRVGKGQRLRTEDWVWLRNIKTVLRNEEEGVPSVGRYNAGQKIIYFISLISMLVMLITGIVMWRSYFSWMFPDWMLSFFSMLHALSATVLICSIIGHIYAGIWIKGSMNAMTKGEVTYGWAYKHHRKWFQDVVQNQTTEAEQSSTRRS